MHFGVCSYLHWQTAETMCDKEDQNLAARWRVSYSSVADHRSRQPVFSPQCCCNSRTMKQTHWLLDYLSYICLVQKYVIIISSIHHIHNYHYFWP